MSSCDLQRKFWDTEKAPRLFDFDPSGKYWFVDGESSGKLAGYRFDTKSGELTEYATHDVGKMTLWVMAVKLVRLSVTDGRSQQSWKR